MLGKEKVVDYMQVVRDFDKSQGKKPDGFDMPLRSAEDEEGVVDYLKVSREYVKYLIDDQSEVIHNEKR